MIYYFVSPDGDHIDKEENAKGWYQKKYNPNMFTVKKEAKAEAVRRMKLRIKELKVLIEEMK